MLGKYAATYVAVVDKIDQILKLLETISSVQTMKANEGKVTLAQLGKEPPLEKDLANAIKGTVDAMVTGIMSRMAFQSVAAQSKRLLLMLDDDVGASTIRAALSDLRLRLTDELNEREFLYVPPERVGFYKEQMLFGQDVNDRFPSAIDDIEGAGKCLALGEGTACVLHCMRVMEVGLRALAGSLGVPYAPSWESYLGQIAARIGAKRKTKGVKWRRDEKFYAGISGDLMTVKQAWRNPTMHVGRKYSIDEAEEIFIAVRRFMKVLATKCCEPNVKKLIKMLS
jgi:hypothetical protein